MTKEEIKNKISMELKDPILQQGFEIICKQIAELEEENKELHRKIIYLQNDKENIIANYYCDRVGECKVAKLERENKDLKWQLKEVVKDNDFYQEENKRLEKENEYLSTKCDELKETLKKVRVALIQERTANFMMNGKGGVEMFNDTLEKILKGL